LDVLGRDDAQPQKQDGQCDGRQPPGATFPGQEAGTVTVALGRQAGWAGPVATVSYDLTALSEAAADGLARFAAGFPQFLRHWEQAIASAVSAPG